MGGRSFPEIQQSAGKGKKNPSAPFVETSNIQSSSFSFSPSLPSLRIHPPFTHFCLRRGKILQQRQIPGAFAVAIPAGPKTGVGAGRLIELKLWRRKPRATVLAARELPVPMFLITLHAANGMERAGGQCAEGCKEGQRWMERRRMVSRNVSCCFRPPRPRLASRTFFYLYCPFPLELCLSVSGCQSFLCFLIKPPRSLCGPFYFPFFFFFFFLFPFFLVSLPSLPPLSPGPFDRGFREMF